MSSKSRAVVRRLDGGRVSWSDLQDSDKYRGGNGHSNGYQPHVPSFSRDVLAEYLHTSLLKERGLETEVSEEVPVSPSQVLRSLDNIKGSGLVLGVEKYFFQHGKVVRRGVTDSVMPDLISEAADMAATNETSVEDWEDITARIRAAQFLADFLGREKSGEIIFLKAECIANFLVLSLMFGRAKKEKNAIRHMFVPGSSMDHALALPPDEIFGAIAPENVLTESTFVEVSAFSGVARVKYHVSVPGAIFKRLVEIMKKAGEQIEYYKSGEAGQGYDEELVEEEMKFSAADSLIRAFRDLERETERLAKETGRPIPGRTNGNGNSKPHKGEPVAVPAQDAPVAELVHEPAIEVVDDDIDPDQQAEDDRLAAEYDAELHAKAAEPTVEEVVAVQMAITAEAAAADPNRVTTVGTAKDNEAPPKAHRVSKPRGKKATAVATS